MAIQLFHSQETLISRGFHVVHVPAKLNAWRGSQYENWCHRCLEGEFMLRIHHSQQRVAGYFQTESDALLFTLRWS